MLLFNSIDLIKILQLNYYNYNYNYYNNLI